MCICIIDCITVCVHACGGHCGVNSLSSPCNGFGDWNLSHCVSALLYLLSHLTKKQLQKKYV